MNLLIVFIFVIVALLLLLNAYNFYIDRQNEAYYRKIGVPCTGAGFWGKLLPLFRLIRGSANMVDMEEALYQEVAKFGAPLVGLCDLTGQKTLVVKDPDILRFILVKDFDHFVNRRPIKTEYSSKYFKKMLGSTENDQWRGIRTRLSPSFTTGRIRRMFQIFQEKGEKMNDSLRGHIGHPTTSSGDVDFAQFFSKYAMSVIASCAFGIELPPEDSTFEKMARQLGIYLSPRILLKVLLMAAAPKVADFFGIDSTVSEPVNFYEGLVKEVMAQREKEGVRREDFLQLMMDAKQGQLKTDQETRQVMHGTDDVDSKDTLLSGSASGGKATFEEDDVIANAMLFLLAGYDTTQSVLLLAVYSLALEAEVQEKLYGEITSILDKHEGQLTYEALSEMTYLDQVINETMRLYSPATRSERYCNKDYPVPGTNIVIEKDTVIVIPVFGMHRDAKHYPDPKKFLPERFTPEGKQSRHPYTYLPFGHGPRNCIGMRFALIKVKVAFAQLIRSFRIAPCAKTEIPVTFGTNAIIKPKGGMWLNITVR